MEKKILFTLLLLAGWLLNRNAVQLYYRERVLGRFFYVDVFNFMLNCSILASRGGAAAAAGHAKKCFINHGSEAFVIATASVKYVFIAGSSREFDE